MAPATDIVEPVQVQLGKTDISTPSRPSPLKTSGALDAFSHGDVTPVIGREYPTVNIVDDILNKPNADDLLRDLAITSE